MSALPGMDAPRGGRPPAASAVGQAVTSYVTVWRDKYGQAITEQGPMTLRELERTICGAKPARIKDGQPLLKLASFGDKWEMKPDKTGAMKRTSLRWDENVRAVHGIAVDYDGEKIPITSAADTLSARGLGAVLYTSASHEPDKPRWRAIVTLARPLEGDTGELQLQHRHWVGVLNAVLGNCLAAESLDLSRSYYFGGVIGKALPHVIRLEGRCLDELEEVPAPVYPTAGTEKGTTGTKPGKRDETTDEELRERIRNPVEKGLRYPAMRSFTSRMAWTGASVEDIESVMLALLGDSPPPFSDGRDPRTVVRHMAQTAVDKYGESRRKNPGTAGGSEGFGGAPNQDPQTIKAPWPEARVIEDRLLPVAPFDPVAMLPEALRDWIKDEADRMPCSPDYIAAAAICGAGMLIGTRCTVRPKRSDSWSVVPNLWGKIVGEPAAKKSPSCKAALAWLDTLIQKATEAHQEKVAAYMVAKVVFQARKEALEERIKRAVKPQRKPKKDETPLPAEDVNELARDLLELEKEAPQDPKKRRYKTNDPTMEAVADLLRYNPTGVLVMRDELAGLIASWDREGRENTRQFFIEGWNGDITNYEVDRVSRDAGSLPNLCLSVFGGTQPDKLTAYLEETEHELSNDGLLQRFQVMVYPDPCPWKWSDRAPNEDARNKAFAIFEDLAELDVIANHGAEKDSHSPFPFFRFDEEAQELFIQWTTDLHGVRIPKEERPIMQQHLLKYDKLCPALALIFHLIDCAGNDKRGPITKDCVVRAAAWCQYLETHARRCYGLLMDEGLRSAKALAEKLLRDEKRRKEPKEGEEPALKDGFTARDVRKQDWRHLKDDGPVQAALDWLEDEGWIRPSTSAPSPKGGRPTVRYEINPALPRKARVS